MGFFKSKIVLPATVLCQSPFIFACFFEDFIRSEDRFGEWMDNNASRYESICALFQIGWYYDNPESWASFRREVTIIHETFPELSLYFLANCEEERKAIEEMGEKVILCHQNAFLREEEYPLVRCSQVYDAIYLARLTPSKRHSLALKIPRLLLVGSPSGRDICYSTGIAERMRPDTVWLHARPQKNIHRLIQRAKVGLALSREDGPMYSATEYALCGLPLLTTQHHGTRTTSLSPEYVYTISEEEPTSGDILAAMKFLLDKNYDPQKIRSATIAILKEHRARFMQLIAEILEKHGKKTDRALTRIMKYPNKLGERNERAKLPFWSSTKGKMVIKGRR